MVDAVLADHRSAPISEQDHAMFAFLEKVNAASQQIGQADVDAVVAAGWPQDAVYDAITVCALFNFYNCWIDATGVDDMPPEAYAASGERIAATGYAPQAPDGSRPAIDE